MNMVVGRSDGLAMRVIGGSGRGNSRASIASVMRWTDGMVLLGSQTTSSGKFSVPSSLWSTSTLPEFALSTSRSVVVGRRWAEALLTLVVTAKEELDQSSDQEEETRGC